MRILAIWSTLFCLGATALLAQPTTAFTSDPIPEGYWLEAQPFVEHSGVVGDTDLTGQTTYRLVLHTADPTAYVSSVGGDASNPFELNSSAEPAWFNHPLGVNIGAEANLALAAFFPDYSYDSWLTIGATSAVPDYTVSTAVGAINPFTAFNAGQNVLVNDAIGFALFNLYPGADEPNHPAFAGDDLSIVLGQITTAGTLSGSCYIQIFPDGTQSSDLRCHFPILSADPASQPGCTDATACNYDEEATEDDGSCAFAEPGYDCNGELTSPEGYWLQAEPWVTHAGTVGSTDLSGQTTYRLVLHTPSPDAFVSAIGGDANSPFELNSTAETAWYNDPITAWDLGSEVTPALFSFIPESAYDSWFTIGATAATDGYDLSTAIGAINPFSAFNSGQNVLVNDSIGFAIFTLYPGDNDPANPAFAGDDQAVTLGQITTAGSLSGYIYVQIFPDGTQSGDLRHRFPILNASPYAIPGCTDDLACNFEPTANEDDGSCSYPDAGYDCDGACVSDADSDGICDEFEIAGCQDETACNYDAAATDDDGSCSYADAGYDCDGICLSDADSDGICDEFEIAGCQDETACNYDAAATDDDGSCSYADAGYDCNGICLNDADSDGICDEFEIAGCQDETACNYDDDATDDDGSCSYADAGYDCDGICLSDADSDGICDEFEIAGCQDETACNYDTAATDDDGSCSYADAGYDCASVCLNDADSDGICDEFEIAGCQDETACNYDVAATDDDGSCAYADAGYDCAGVCLNDADSDGICDEFEIAGCQDETACNYDVAATDDDGSCAYADAGYDCAGVCLNDADSDGICDEFEIAGCQDETACNYEASATDDDGSCEIPAIGFDCDGTDLMEGLPDGYWLQAEPLVEHDGMLGTTDLTGHTTYRLILHTPTPNAFISAIGGDANHPFELYSTSTPAWINHPLGVNTGAEFNPSLLTIAPELAYDSWLTIGATQAVEGYNLNLAVGQINPFIAFNNNENTVVDDELGFALFTTYPGGLDLTHPAFAGDDYAITLGQITTTGTLSGWIYIQIFPQGLQEIDLRHRFPILNGNPYEGEGCTDALACNYDPNATTENGSCTYPSSQYVDCDGTCTNDSDFDGVCDEFEVSGCQDETACNYNADATDEDGSCAYADAGYNCDGVCLNDADLDGVCDEFEIAGCQDAEACNYNADATDEDGSCTYAVTGYNCDGVCLNDADMDGVCDEFEISGCQDAEACNYNADATDDDGSCTYAVTGYDCDGVCLNDADMDGVCDEFEISGCQDAEACNYNEDATDEDGSCTYAVTGYDCDGNCINDADLDGVCDEFEIAGCQDAEACNYNADATDEDGTCTYAVTGYDCDGVCLNDADMDGVCDEFEIAGCQDAEACNYNEDATDEDGSCTYAVTGYDCDGNCINDADLDGVCDEFEIAGCQDAEACNYNADATDENGSCAYPVIGYDCDGNCNNDADLDGVCDEFEIAGCQDESACNYNENATDEDGSCTYAVTGYDCNGNCINDADLDGVCDEFEIAGCQDAEACNYNADATDDDGSCNYAETGYNCDGNCISDADMDGVCDEFEIAGCQDEIACNYNENATDEDGSCTYAETGYDCDGNCINDADLDGVCDEFEIAGCQDETACNYNADATDEDGSCTYAVTGYDCNGNCINDADLDGVCDEFEIAGCQDETACNYNADATDEDGSCTYAVTGYDCDGNCINDADLDGVCDEFEIAGCQDETACNYNADATDEDGSCTYAVTGYDCDGNCINDADLDGVCDEFEIAGCQDEIACNYNENATDEDGSCTYAETGYDCDGNCINDADLDGVCDEFEIAGCQDETACNYNADATDEDGSCTYAVTGYDCDGNCINDADLDGVCDEFEIAGCQDEIACNYNENATDEDGSCTYAVTGYDCDGNCINDADLDGVCDEFEIAGCQDEIACNYNENATDEDGSCTYAVTGYDCDGNCINDADLDGVCDEFEIAGCQDAEACNYNADATDEDGSCTYPTSQYVDCEGNCINDADSDGVCDEFEVAGCQDETACNYDADATDEDGSCTYADAGYDCDGICLQDADGDGICDEFEIAGCQDEAACNYNADATDEDDSCTYAESGYDCNGICVQDTDGDGVCDPFEIEGCTDDTACNYDEEATDENGSCTYAETGYDCDGICLQDTDADGICDEFEIAGCQDEEACNYSAEATDEDGSCTYAETGYDCNGNCLQDADGDGICDEFEVPGCIDTAACNFNDEATDEDGSCTYPEFAYDCDGNCLVDTDGDGVCDPLEVPGCMDTDACNYDPEATDENGTCTYPETEYDCDGNCLSDVDGDGICDAFEVLGCTDETACNFQSDATENDGSCSYADEGYDCAGNCLEDTDGDGVCDPFEVAGCTDPLACNFDPEATDYDGSCTYPELEYDCDGNCLQDTDGDGICDAFEIPGCTDAAACNYDVDATDDDASCTYPEMGLDCNGEPLPCEACYAVFEPALTDQTLSCADDLPTEPMDVTATGFCTGAELEVSAFVGDVSGGVITNGASTAYGSGPDAAIRINGLAEEGLAPTNLWFEEEPLTVTRFSNGTALVEGVVRNNVNADLAWEVHMVFEGEQAADEFLAESPFHGLITAYGCPIDTANMLTYVLKNDQSYLQGMGGYAGSYLALSHMPTSESKRFQLGYGGNGHNCQYGFGGWFSWEGMVQGEPVIGLVGDLVVDLTEDDVVEPTACGQDAVYIHYTAYDPTCNLWWNAVQHFEVVDEEGPVFVSGPADVVTTCGEVPPVAELDAFEVAEGCSNANVDLAYVGETSQTGACPNEFIITRTWQASDCLGNTTEYVQTITGIDDVAPVISDLPADIYFGCDEDVFYLTPTATDDCGEVTLTSSVEDVPGTCGTNYNQIVTWTATDACGNSTTAVQTLHIEDTTPPTFVNTEAEVIASCGDLSSVVAQATDACNDVTLSYTDATIAGGCLGSAGTVVRTWSAEDACGNTAFFTQTIELTDDIAPEISLNCALELVIDGTACEADTSFAALGAPEFTVTDNCGDVATVWSYEDSEAVTSCEGFIFVRTFTLTATDACGNSSTATCPQTIEVVDTTGPVISMECPADIVLEGNAACEADVSTDVTGTATATAVDGCDGAVAVEVTFVDGPALGGCAGGSSFERTFTATAVDVCGNAGEPVSCTQTITIEDTTAPEFNPYPLFVSVECSALGDPTDVNYLPLTAADACSADVMYSVEASMTAGGCPGTWVRIWTAQDACGNAVTTEQYLTLFDNTEPALSVASEATTALDENGNWSVDLAATATDNCSSMEDGTLTITSVDGPATMLCAGDDATPEGSFELVRTWTAEDFCNITNSATTVITVLDTTAPQLTAETVTVECSDYDALIDWGGWNAMDNADSEVAVTWTDEATDAANGCYTVLRTLTAVDDCGNASEVVQTLIIEDTTPPTFTSVPADQTNACTEASYTAVAVDACSDVTVTESRTVLSEDACGNSTQLVTLVATDACNNAASVQFTITVLDDEAPVWDGPLPEDTTLACGEPLEAIELTASDNCGAEVLVSVEETFEEGACAGSGVWTRVWTATDCSGNATTHTQLVSVEDTTAPTFTSEPADQLNACEEAAYVAEAVDDCSEVTLTESREVISEDACGNYSHLVTLTATDACGNAATTQFTITVQDDELPVWDSPLPADLEVACTEVPAASTLTASDNCGAEVTVELTETWEPAACEGLGAWVRTWTATDCSGNAISHVQTLSIIDTQAPEFDGTLPADVTASCEAIPEAATLSATDACGGSVTVTFQADTLAGGCTGSFTIERTWTATDCSGNFAEYTQLVTVEDTTPPAFTEVPEDQISACSEQPYTALATDACSEVTLTESREVLSDDACGNYSHLVTITATDACGNSTTAQFTITVQDEVAPEFVEALPADLTAACGEVPTAPVLTATDNCLGAVNVAFEEVTTPAACAGQSTIVRTWTATDCSGNATVHSQVIEVEDTTPPVFTLVPADQLASCAELPYTAEAFDACSEATITESRTVLSDDACGNYVHLVTLTATDACGNATDTTFTIEVNDATAPTFNEALPTDLTVECNSVPAAESLTASDNCSEVTVAFVESFEAGACEGTGVWTRTWTATDCSGNAVDHTQFITVIDTEAPEIVAEALIEVSVEAFVMDSAYASATDGCSTALLSFSDQNVAGGCTGTIVRTYVAEDACGNASAPFEQSIVLIDTLAPEVLTNPADVTFACDEVISVELPTAVDNFDANLDISFADEVLETFSENTYDVLRTFTIADDCGNSTTTSVVISVVDEATPEVVFLAAAPVMETTEWDESLLAFYQPVVEDNCSAETGGGGASAGALAGTGLPGTWAYSTVSDNCAGSFNIVVDYTFSDADGNTLVVPFTLAFEDAVDPVILSVPADVTLACDAVLPEDLASATDNATAAEDLIIAYTDEVTPGACDNEFTIVRTHTVTDDCGNTAQATQILTLLDDQAPTFTFVPSDTTVSCSETLPEANATAEDACGTVTVTASDAIVAAGVVGNYTLERTFTATDACGNAAMATQFIEVVDTVAPVFDAEPGDLIVTHEAWLAIDLMDYAPTYSDACDANASLEMTVVITNEVCPGTFVATVTYTATDASGNQSSVSNTATVTDTAVPVISYVPADAALSCDEEVPFEWIVATDDATADGDLVYAYEDVIIEGSCSTEYQIERNFTVTDGCGNSSAAVQVFTVSDSTAPVLQGTCEVGNGETITLCFDSYGGTFTLPDACALDVTDNCDAGTEIVYTEVIEPALAEGTDVTQGYCTVATPEVLPDDLTCDNMPPYSLFLGNFVGEAFYESLDGTATHLDDGSFVISQTVVASNNPNAGWEISVTFTEGLNWTDWMATPGPQSYRYVCGTMVNDHENWLYHLMTAGTMVGWGDYDGSVLNLTHQPSNGYYAMQEGFGANNKNSNYGYSADFFYSGTFDGVSVNGTGDLFGDLDCTQPVTVTRTYTATDCAGNSTNFEYSLSVQSTSCLPTPPIAGPYEDEEDNTPSGFTTGTHGIEIVALQPNPASDNAFLNFVTDKDVQVAVQLYSLQGNLISDIFHGQVFANTPQTLEFRVKGLDAGTYSVMISTSDDRLSRLLMVIQ